MILGQEKVFPRKMKTRIKVFGIYPFYCHLLNFRIIAMLCFSILDIMAIGEWHEHFSYRKKNPNPDSPKRHPLLHFTKSGQSNSLIKY